MKNLSFLVEFAKVGIDKITKYNNFNCAAKSNTLPDYTFEHIHSDYKKSLINALIDLKNVFLSKNFSELIILGNEDINLIKNFIDKMGCIQRVVVVFNHYEEVDQKNIDFLRDYCNKKNIRLEIDFFNFNFYSQTEIIYRRYRTDNKTLILITNLVEHLDDPIPLMRLIKNILLLNLENEAILGSVVRKTDYLDIPENKSHYREWAIKEMIELLLSLGFNLDQVYEDENSSLLVTRFNAKRYDKFVWKYFNTDVNKSYFIVTTEHAGIEKTGGIGSYVEELYKLLSDIVQVVFIDTSNSLFEVCIKNNVLHHKLFFDDKTSTKLVNLDYISEIVSAPNYSYLVYEFIYYLNYYFQIKVIELQDYLALGFRTIQAKKAGLLQEEIIIRTCAHGNNMYVVTKNQELVHPQNLMLINFEKYVLENCDEFTSPSNYLKNIYKDYGIDTSKCKVVRYGFNERLLNDIQPRYNLKQIEELVFIGKLNKVKGFDVFADAVMQLIKNNKLGSVKRVKIYAPYHHSNDEIREKYTRLCNEIQVVHEYVSREKLVKILLETDQSLYIYPSRADNYSYAILEAMIYAQQFLITNAGGHVEIIPEKYHDKILFSPNDESLARRIEDIIRLSSKERSLLYAEIKRDVANNIKIENNKTIKYMHELLKAVSDSDIKSYKFPNKSDITVIIPVYNTELTQVKDAIYSINVQTTKPKEVIVVDDGSEYEYSIKLKELVEKESKFTYQFIRQSNKGLPGARNTALKICKTKYIFDLDSDDCLHPEYISLTNAYLEKFPQIISCTVCCKHFGEYEDVQKISFNNSEYHHSIQTYALGSVVNSFSPAYTVFRTEDLYKIGGWDDSDKSAWEDWSLGLHLTCIGYRMEIIPITYYYYRIRQNSMLRTFSMYPRYLRMIRNNILLPKFESYVRYVLLRTLQDNFAMCSKYLILNGYKISARSIGFKIYMRLYGITEFLVNKYPFIKRLYIKIKALLKKLVKTFIRK
ncbi:MAG: glycosyltransferase [Candidatus Dojkabacteria bacterium]|nr:glycosyltransferase [Candidatus Dojkabacteria bacterium]